MRVPANRLYSPLVLLFVLLIGTSLFAQDPATKKLVNESVRLRDSHNSPDTDLEKATREARDRANGFSDALRDWIESRLPKSKSALDAETFTLQDRLNAELFRARVRAPATGIDDYGYVGRLEVWRPAPFTDALAVVAGTSMPCGTSDSVYVYDFSAGTPRRVLESRGGGDTAEAVSDIYFSSQDASGGRAILTLRHAIQCGSSWNDLSYNLFSLRGGVSAAVPIFSGERGGLSASDHPYNVQLKPDGLLIELRSRSIDSRIRSRTNVLRYTIASQSVKRIDPVALQPQDFVHEWLTRPWPEMEPRSAAVNRDKLEKWHNFLSGLNGDFVAADIDVVQPCTETFSEKHDEQSGDWKIALNMKWAAGKELPEQFKLYFLVHGLGKYRFEMAAIAFEPPDGCPGQMPPGSESPSLFQEDPGKNGPAVAVPF